jgi:hypothetical protein
MADAAAIVFGWKVLDAAVVSGKSDGPGVGIRMGEKDESGLRACFFYFGRVLWMG